MTVLERIKANSRLSLFILLTVSCCKAAPSSAPVAQASPAPEWVTKGSGAFGFDGTRVFYGVGLAVKIKNVALLRTTADNRARAEISKIFETYSASLMKDYMGSTIGAPDQASEEQHVGQAIKTFSAQTLSGVEIVDHYKDPETGAMYALARLRLDSFRENLVKMRELSQRLRDYVQQNAERVHQDLENPERKGSGP